MNQTVTYLQELTAIPSPTGFTREIADYLVKTIEGFGYEVTRTAKGGVNVTVPGVITDKQRYVTAHVDTLGAIVRAVKADGRLKLDRIGGFPWNMIEGENCTVHVANTGKTHSGTILVHQTSCHVYKDAGTVERTQDNMEVRLDEKVTNEKETRALGIEVGDFVSFDPRTIVTDTGFIKSRHLDDKVSAAILLNLLRVYKEENIQLPVTTTFAFNREAYAAQLNGKDGASKIIRNLYIPPTFVQANGKTFGEMVKTQLDTYGDEWKSTKLDDGQNGLFDAKKAKEEFAKAKTALEAEGVKFPIHIDMPVDQTTPSRVQRVQSFKQSVEEALGKENIVIDIQMLSKEDLQNVTLFAPNAAGEDWDLSDNVGWSPDYQDPSTYMDILKASSGENTKTFLGFDPSENNEAAKKVGLYDFEKMIKDAGAETQDVNKRYEKYAAAQAWLTDSALVMPTSSSTGRPFLTRIEPFSAPFAWTGGKGKDHVIYKGMKLQDKAVTTADYNKALEKWQKEQAESNKKAQEDLKKHVK